MFHTYTSKTITAKEIFTTVIQKFDRINIVPNTKMNVVVLI